ncbi:TRM11 family SAM-dependent methyltransferase [Spongiactinospora rosea]|uniref:TRM11 family SAM-dependent methyltransferase n=1 Tax=Spongiactinospora rosea TaxID=2248750 RepID=UPI0018F5A4B9|nr:RNA methyltransferase [Spongiactinospora rosea]
MSGLETAVAREVLGERLGTVTWIGHREVRFTGSVAGSTALRTADDAFLLAATMPDIGRGREALGALTRLAEQIAGIDTAGHAGVEVSASFLGRRNFSRYDLEDAAGAALAVRLGLPYHSRRDGTPPPPGYGAWRLTLDGTDATLMLRVAPRPLHRRAYKRHTVPGTLHPPVAAAMARLADIRPGDLVADPCCGAGTLLIEAARLQPEAVPRGYDLNPDALRAARANASAAGLGRPTPTATHPRGYSLKFTAPRPNAGLSGPLFEPADAAALPLPDGSVDRLLANPPWGGQVPPRGRLARTPSALWPEIRRLLRPDGRAVVLIPDTAELASAIAHGLLPAHVQHVSLSGAHPHIAVLTPAPQPGTRR